MKRLILFGALWALVCSSVAQNNRTTRLLEYFPAPGQFINNPLIGTPGAAEAMLTDPDAFVSLGSFGGYIVLGFENPVLNHPENPYGIDFTIFGNAFAGSSEAGIIWVMKDENNNQLPDDTWYQIAGSSHHHPETRHNASITWWPMEDGAAGWKNEHGEQGLLLKNEFHAQSYYPIPSNFPAYPQDSVRFRGTLLGHSSMIMNNQIVLPTLAFGYADNQPVIRGVDRSIPDNPYTTGVREGAGGDPVDISWAVDSAGNYVDLDWIDFVKIVTGALSDLGILGEISTEISGAWATRPTGQKGKETLNVIHPHKQLMAIQDTMTLYADFFVKGKRVSQTFVFENSDRTKADISPQGTITAIDGGTIRVLVSPEGFPDDSASTEIYIQKPVTIQLDGLENMMPFGTRQDITPVLYDQNGIKMAGIQWSIINHTPELIQIESRNNGYSLTALAPGEAKLEVYPVKYSYIRELRNVVIMDSGVKTLIYGSAKTMLDNLVPFQWMVAEPVILNGYVENRKRDYGTVQGKNAAEVVAGMLKSNSLNFTFREEIGSDTLLYLYSIEKDGLFTYGWGGKTEPSAFARSWILRHNGESYFHSWERINVLPGDTLLLYHVDNILKDWQLTMLDATKDSINADEPIELNYHRIQCHRDVDGKIIETELTGMQNQPVYINDDQSPIAYTDSYGYASFVPENEPPFTVWSGPDAISILPALITNSTVKHVLNLQLFPNPAFDKVTILGIENEAMIRVTDMTGRLIYLGNLTSMDHVLSVKEWEGGLYLVELRSGKESIRIKLLKQ